MVCMGYITYWIKVIYDDFPAIEILCVWFLGLPDWAVPVGILLVEIRMSQFNWRQFFLCVIHLFLGKPVLWFSQFLQTYLYLDTNNGFYKNYMHACSTITRNWIRDWVNTINIINCAYCVRDNKYVNHK